MYIYIYIYTHEGGSKSFQPDQLFEVTEQNNFAIFQNSLPLFQHILIVIH